MQRERKQNRPPSIHPSHPALSSLSPCPSHHQPSLPRTLSPPPSSLSHNPGLRVHGLRPGPPRPRPGHRPRPGRREDVHQSASVRLGRLPWGGRPPPGRQARQCAAGAGRPGRLGRLWPGQHGGVEPGRGGLAAGGGGKGSGGGQGRRAGGRRRRGRPPPPPSIRLHPAPPRAPADQPGLLRLVPPPGAAVWGDPLRAGRGRVGGGLRVCRCEGWRKEKRGRERGRERGEGRGQRAAASLSSHVLTPRPPRMPLSLSLQSSSCASPGYLGRPTWPSWASSLRPWARPRLASGPARRHCPAMSRSRPAPARP